MTHGNPTNAAGIDDSAGDHGADGAAPVLVGPLTAHAVAELRRKYALIAELRAGVGARAAEEVRGPLRELAREFPGALREVDVLSMPRLTERRQELERAEEPYPLWIRVVYAYHRVMAVSLWLKGQLSVRAAAADHTALAAEAAALHGVGCQPAWVAAVADPPAGRLNQLVFAQLAGQFEVSVDELRSLIFPRETSGACGPDQPIALGTDSGERG